MSIPFNAIDPDAERRRWLSSFEYHLDLIPPVLDAVIMTTLPTIPVSRGGSRFDRDQVTGGGFIDNMSDALRAFDLRDTADGVKPSHAVVDANELWAWVVEYTRAVNDRIEQPEYPAPILPVKVNADPLTARALAQSAVAWLVTHSGWVETFTDLDEHREAMFGLIRRLRGKYGVHPTPRRNRPRRVECENCLSVAVQVVWIDNPNGSPQPVQVAKCDVCGTVYTEE